MSTDQAEISNKVLVDIGNTRIKLVESHNGEFIYRQQKAWKGADLPSLLDHLLDSVDKPDQVALSNVAGPEMLTAWETACKRLWGITPIVAETKAEQHGLINAYPEPDRLGVDRWLAMLAGWTSQQTEVCIIDCGSATTIDRVAKDGHHLGGLILPGLRLLTDSLSRQTHALDTPLAESEQLLADNTDDAINAGCTQLFYNGIEGILQGIDQATDDKIEYIITGGDAAFLIDKLQRTLHHEPDLVLKGLEISTS